MHTKLVKSIQKLIFLACLGTLLFLHPHLCQAQQSEVALTAIPPRLGDDFSLKAKPGEKIQTTIRVRNTSPQPITIKTTVEDFILDEDGQTPIPLNSDEHVSSRWSLASWIRISPEEQTIQPQKDTVVNVLIDIPADALPGGHYAVILHQPDNLQQDTPGSQSSIGQRVGTLVYFLVDGPINEEAVIRDFHFPRFTEYGPVPFSFVVENLSDVHIAPQLGVEIYNLFGQKIDTISIEGRNVFPFIGRTFKGTWNRKWGIGPYTAKVIMSYGSQGQVAIATTSFWLLPITLVLAILLGIIILLVIALLIKKRISKRSDYQKKKIETLEKKLQQFENDKH